MKNGVVQNPIQRSKNSDEVIPVRSPELNCQHTEIISPNWTTRPKKLPGETKQNKIK